MCRSVVGRLKYGGQCDDVLYGVKAKYRGNNPLCKLEKSVRGTQKISMNVGSLSVEDLTALICIHSPNLNGHVITNEAGTTILHSYLSAFKLSPISTFRCQ